MSEYIGKQEAIDYCREKQKEIDCERSKALYDCFIEIIKNQPAADVQEVKHGKWIKHSVDIAEHPLHCSLCGWSNYRISNREVIDFGFCPNPNCGAKMDGDEK